MNHRKSLPLLALPFLLSVSAACGDEPRTTPPIVYEPVGTNNGEAPNNGSTSNNGTVTNNNGTAPNNGIATNNGTTTNNGTATNNGTTATNNGTTATNNGTTPTNNNTVPSGETCPNATIEPFSGECDVVRNQGCTEPEQCFVALQINGPAVDVSSACFESDVHVLPEDAFCEMTEERCAPGLLCISYLRICKRLCYLADGAGCMPDEWCVQPDQSWKGVGYCADSCE